MRPSSRGETLTMDVVTFVDWVIAVVFAISAWVVLVALMTVCGVLVIQMIKDLYRKHKP